MHEELSKAILQDLLQDFLDRGLGADALRKSYQGPSLSALKRKYCEEGSSSAVDFDLAVQDLEKEKSIQTGPMVAYENTPGWDVMMIGLYSKREYVSLTEKGYKAAHKGPVARTKTSSHLHISGSTFHHSLIGVGADVTQTVTRDASSHSEAIAQLLQLLSVNGMRPDTDIEQDVVRMVEVTNQGNIAEAKPLFQKLFGLAAESVKNVAWGILTTLITKRMGL